jgi:hypothetical protein
VQNDGTLKLEWRKEEKLLKDTSLQKQVGNLASANEKKTLLY